MFYTEVSGEYAAWGVTTVFCTWMVKIKAANCFKKCWIDGGEKKGGEGKGGIEKAGRREVWRRKVLITTSSPCV